MVFLFGTLRHRPLLEAVLGRPVSDDELTPATLPDHETVWARGQGFPLLRATPGARAEGLLLAEPTDAELARLDFYESVFCYRLAPVSVTCGAGARAARAWFPPPGRWQPGAPFDLHEWVRLRGAINTRAAAEVMGWFGRLDAGEVAAMYPMIAARAASFVAAQAGSEPASHSGMTRADVDSRALERPYGDFFAIEEHYLKFRRFDGTQGPTVKRAVFMLPDAALVLPYDPHRDCVLLIEQFRAGPFARGDRAPWTLEPIAGRIDAGETPEEAARREAWEEAGLNLDALEVVARGYPSPGASSEFYHIFLACTDLSAAGRDGGGLDSEDEDIRGHVICAERLIEMADAGALNVAPLELCAHWLARHRPRLRAQA
jgi:nudix-type nucleoside diphosphatase (YffH/AdpP family)